MKLRSSQVMLISFLLFCPVLSFGKDPEVQSQAQEILGESLKKMASLVSYSAEILKESKQGVVKMVHWQWTAPDGFLHSRYEVEKMPPEDGKPKSLPPKLISLTNRQGSWLLNEKQKIAINVKNSPGATATASVQKVMQADFNGYKAEYEKSEMIHKEIPCWRITQKFDQKVQDLILEQTIATLSKGTQLSESRTDRLKKRVPVLVVYTISKADHILYGQETFSSSGDKISSYLIDKFILGVPLDEGLFNVPKGYKVKTALNEKEVGEFMIELFMGK